MSVSCAKLQLIASYRARGSLPSRGRACRYNMLNLYRSNRLLLSIQNHATSIVIC